MSSESLRQRLEAAAPGKLPHEQLGAVLALNAHAPTDLRLALDVIDKLKEFGDAGYNDGEFCPDLFTALDAFEASP